METRIRCSAKRTPGKNDAASSGEDSSKTATTLSTVRTAHNQYAKGIVPVQRPSSMRSESGYYRAPVLSRSPVGGNVALLPGVGPRSPRTSCLRSCGQLALPRIADYTTKWIRAGSPTGRNRWRLLRQSNGRNVDTPLTVARESSFSRTSEFAVHTRLGRSFRVPTSLLRLKSRSK